jgi:asparagine synthase (glutamine-hydrolysing)
VSGIVALYYPDGRPVSRPVLEEMTGSLAHRGPDGSGCWLAGQVGLGHATHRTTPESARVKHPVRSAGTRGEGKGGNLVLSADARIDNRRELLPLLDVGGKRPDEISDEELILLAYEKWGEACPEEFLGDFAFALWDGREKKLFCARDQIGTRPFYYHGTDRLFLCASEIKAILRHPEAERLLNEERVADYLGMVFEDKAGTFYRNIFRLPPGHSLTVGPRGLTLRSYWALDRDAAVRLGSDEEYAAAFDDIFTDALRCRMRSPRPPGFLLSGGLDSSSMVCKARCLGGGGEGNPLLTFSASFHDFPQVDEQNFIDEVIKGGGVEPAYVRADRVSPLHDIEGVLRHQDEPFHAPNLFVYWILAEEARRRGVDVLIDGVDGDTTVSHGMEFLVELLWSGRLRALGREIGWTAKRFGHSRKRFLWHYVVVPGILEPLRNGWLTLTGRRWKDFDAVPPTVDPAFARRVGWGARRRALLAESTGPVRSLKEAHRRQVTSGILPFYLEVNDKAAAAFGIDHRHPFYDRRLIEFCYGLPPEQKLNKGWDRVVQRRAMEGILPERIRRRITKSHWGPNFKRGLIEFDRDRVESVLFGKEEAVFAYLDIVALREAYARCRSGRISERDGMAVWTAVTLGLWLRQTELSA